MLWYETHDEAEELSRENLRDKLEKMNEIREQLATQRGVFASKEYVEGEFKLVRGKIDAMRNMAFLALIAAIGSLAVFIITNL
jgi:hypothetical protein